MNLALIDNNSAFLSQAKSSVNASKVETYEMDVSDLAQWQSVKQKVEQTFGGVDLLVLNAGIGLKGSWEDSEYFHKVCSA